MKLLLDACVLYPTVMRDILLGCAHEGLFSPLWSERLLEEWRRAAAKRGGAAQQVIAEGEIAMARAGFPDAVVSPPPSLAARLWLPDPADIHVLAAAIAGSADAIITLNAKDFPKHILQEEGLTRHDPDGWLSMAYAQDPEAVARVADTVLARARALSGAPWEMRALMKKSRLPRLGKALAARG